MHALSLEQKASLTSGATTWTSEGVEDIPSMHMSDGPHGLRYQLFPGKDYRDHRAQWCW